MTMGPCKTNFGFFRWFFWLRASLRLSHSPMGGDAPSLRLALSQNSFAAKPEFIFAQALWPSL